MFCLIDQIRTSQKNGGTKNVEFRIRVHDSEKTPLKMHWLFHFENALLFLPTLHLHSELFYGNVSRKEKKDEGRGEPISQPFFHQS